LIDPDIPAQSEEALDWAGSKYTPTADQGDVLSQRPCLLQIVQRHQRSLAGSHPLEPVD
jgi:hypothetical protein